MTPPSWLASIVIALYAILSGGTAHPAHVRHVKPHQRVVHVATATPTPVPAPTPAAPQPTQVPTAVPPATATPPPAPPEPTPTPAHSAVAIRSMAFTTPHITPARDGTVTWTNLDSMPHTVTSDDGSWGSGRLDPGAAYSHVFAGPGTYTYHCNFHPFMTGTVVAT